VKIQIPLESLSADSLCFLFNIERTTTSRVAYEFPLYRSNARNTFPIASCFQQFLVAHLHLCSDAIPDESDKGLAILRQTLLGQLIAPS
jgi:hypothetical protein